MSYEKSLVAAPTQGGIPNAFSIIPLEGGYVPLGAGLDALNTNCIDLTFDATTGQLIASIIEAPTQAGIDNALICIPGEGLYVPDPCGVSVIYSNANPIRLQQYVGGVCTFFELPVLDLTAPPCTDEETLDVTLGVRDGAFGWFKSAEQRKTTNLTSSTITLIPTSDFVILVDNSGGSIIVTLDPPDNCDPSLYHIKATTISVNEITVSPSSGTIDGAVNALFSATVGLNAMTSMMVFFDGTNWWIL